jgi:rubrerythrin
MRDVFVQFAKEEMGHKAFLEKVKLEGSFDLPTYKIVDIRIADYTIPQEKDVDKLNYPESLILAMRREKAAYDLYKKIAASAENEKYAALFESLAQEELKHKIRFETEYDDYLSKEN